MPRDLTLPCPAKVNLVLSVGPPDGRGYHPIASWMVAIDLADDLTLRRIEGTSTFDPAFAEGAPRPGVIDWPIESDLAFRAHRSMEVHARRLLPVAVTLRKRIPTGAGLGGGSSDAAGMLVGLDALFDLRRPTDTLAQIGRSLGSDVPFLVRAMRGEPSAVVTGLGERIEPAVLPRPIDLVLMLPALRIATGPVYAAFDSMTGGAARLREDAVRALARDESFPPHAPFNDLAAPAMRVTPALAECRRQIADATAMPVHVTGSGAAMFVVAASPAHAARVVDRVHAETALGAGGGGPMVTAVAVRTRGSSVSAARSGVAAHR